VAKETEKRRKTFAIDDDEDADDMDVDDRAESNVKTEKKLSTPTPTDPVEVEDLTEPETKEERKRDFRRPVKRSVSMLQTVDLTTLPPILQFEYKIEEFVKSFTLSPFQLVDNIAKTFAEALPPDPTSDPTLALNNLKEMYDRLRFASYFFVFVFCRVSYRFSFFFFSFFFYLQRNQRPSS
jgi:hypothetical protein